MDPTQRKLSEIEKIKLFHQISNVLKDPTASVLGACEAIAPLYNITVDTARGIYRRISAHPKYSHGSHLFTFKQEQSLVATLDAFSLLNRPLDRQGFFRIVKELKKDDSEWDPRGWFGRFMERWEGKLTERSIKELSHSRVETSTLDNVKSWVEWFPSWMEKNNLSSKWIINADETRVTIEGAQHTSKVITGKRKNKQGSLKATRTKCATYIPFVASNGQLVFDVFIAPLHSNNEAKVVLKGLSRRKRGECQTYWGFTESGYLDGELWLPILKKLQEHMAILAPGIEPLLLVDNLSVHKSPEALKFCVNNNIHVAFLPSNTTHFLQPEDDLIFAQFKKVLVTHLQKMLVAVTAKERALGTILLQAAQEARKAITPEVVRAAFKRVGICPFDKEVILKAAYHNIGEEMYPPSDEEEDYEWLVTLVKSTIRESLGTEEYSTVLVAPKAAQLYDGEEILRLGEESAQMKKEQAEAKKEAQEKKKQEILDKKRKREEQHENFQCRGDHDDQGKVPVWKDSGAWIWCEYCDEFGLCPRCKNKCKKQMEAHEADCAKNA